jgi:hypothetical protein
MLSSRTRALPSDGQNAVWIYSNSAFLPAAKKASRLQTTILTAEIQDAVKVENLLQSRLIARFLDAKPSGLLRAAY